MSTVPTHRKAKWLGAVALAALAAGGTAGSFAQTAAPAQTQAVPALSPEESAALDAVLNPKRAKP